MWQCQLFPDWLGFPKKLFQSLKAFFGGPTKKHSFLKAFPSQISSAQYSFFLRLKSFRRFFPCVSCFAYSDLDWILSFEKKQIPGELLNFPKIPHHLDGINRSLKNLVFTLEVSSSV